MLRMVQDFKHNGIWDHKIIEQRLKGFASQRIMMPYRILCNGTEQKSPEARSRLALTPSRFTPLHKIRYGIILFKGIVGIRNKKAHTNVILDNPVRATEYLSLASLLMRLLDQFAG
jgi:hypothetical protein